MEMDVDLANEREIGAGKVSGKDLQQQCKEINPLRRTKKESNQCFGQNMSGEFLIC